MVPISECPHNELLPLCANAECRAKGLLEVLTLVWESGTAHEDPDCQPQVRECRCELAALVKKIMAKWGTRQPEFDGVAGAAGR